MKGGGNLNREIILLLSHECVTHFLMEIRTCEMKNM